MPSREGASLEAPARPAATGTGGPMVELEGGTFLMGTADADAVPTDGEGPVREVTVAPFAIETTTVTNQQFAAFVKASRYVTEAEQYGWSFVFAGLVPEATAKAATMAAAATPWWWRINGASWKEPEGPGTSIASRQNHPVVHVSHNDALAYASWCGRRLPTEAEWEFAARGGLEQKRYPWGDDLRPDGAWRCNIWQGTFPTRNTLEDGHLGTAPASAFRPNRFGLYNMSGNVWEWTSDWFSAVHDDGPPASGTGRVQKGGSFLCHDSYCNRYRVAARHSSTPDSSSSNVGFRCAR